MVLFDELSLDIGYFVLGNMIASLIILLLLFVFIAKHNKLKKRYKEFMITKDGQNLESEILDRFQSLQDIQEHLKITDEKIDIINTKLISTFQKIGIVKYDAFKEMGGMLSFALALLDENNSGFLINAMHSSRDGCYTYIKEITKGVSDIPLAEEEQQALDKAML